MPFYDVTIHNPDGGAWHTPFEANDDASAVRDGLSYAAEINLAIPGEVVRVTVDTLEIGRYDPAQGIMQTSRSRRLHDSAGDPDDNITVTELPARRAS